MPPDRSVTDTKRPRGGGKKLSPSDRRRIERRAREKLAVDRRDNWREFKGDRHTKHETVEYSPEVNVALTSELADRFALRRRDRIRDLAPGRPTRPGRLIG